MTLFISINRTLNKLQISNGAWDMTETVSGKVSQLPETWAYYLLLFAIFITLLVLAIFLGIKTFSGIHKVRDLR